MKTIINAKNALALIFLIPILTSAISFAIPNGVNYRIPTVIYLCCNLISGLSCLYLVCTENEFITNRKQKISMYILTTYYIICIGLISRFFYLINENYSLHNIVSNVCADETMVFIYTSMIYGFFGLFFWVGFLMFTWGIPTKKSQRWLITLFLCVPYIYDVIWPFLTPIIENIVEYRYMIFNTLEIASYGLMLYLILKAYKTKINID